MSSEVQRVRVDGVAQVWQGDVEVVKAASYEALEALSKTWRDRALTAEARQEHAESIGDTLANVIERQAAELASAHAGQGAGVEVVEAQDGSGLVEALELVLGLDVRGHSVRDRLQFSTAGREVLDKAEKALAGNRQAQPYQGRVTTWLLSCFGARIACDAMERNCRFLEEALELVQACGCTEAEAQKLVAYVYGRDVGEKSQEAGGVMVTLAAICFAQGMDMHQAGEVELSRIIRPDVMKRIREKQARKPAMSPLPGSYPERTAMPDKPEA